MGCSGSKDTASAPPQQAPPGSGTPPAPTPVEPPANGGGEDAPVPLKLSPAQLTSVKELFAQFDVDSIGKLPLENFSDTSLKVGPHESHILSKLKEMDYDGDGTITTNEWETYFAAMAALNEDEFKMMIGEMGDYANTVCSIIRCTRLAADDAPAPPADELEPPAALAPDRVAIIDKLFSAWDVTGSGQIDRRKLKDAGGTLGPHKVQIFAQLEAMDVNKDNVVTKDEMLDFFQAAVALSDDEFKSTTDDMMAVAQDEATIAMLTSMAAEFAGGAPPAEDLEAVTPLSAERLEALKNLWGLLSPSIDKPVSLESMKKTEKGSTIGPHSVSVLKEMYAMDANSDGYLQWSELLDYFTTAGAQLSDDEYTEIVGDMTTRIQMQLLAEMVTS